MQDARVITVRPQTVLVVLGLVLVYRAWHVITWILIAALLAAAMNPAVEALERRGLNRRRAATVVFAITLALVIGVGFVVVPPLVSQVTDFVDAVPHYVDDLTAGRGPLGFLQDRYHVVDRVEEAIHEHGTAGVVGL